MFSLAMVRLLEIVGEAARHTSEEFRQGTPQIPWKQIAGTRDRLIHGYFDVDLDIVWAIVINDLPSLIAELEKTVSV
ncbi:MAG: HepT-like ribonuclease domain-containing protein [Blastocatellia bacterium]